MKFKTLLIGFLILFSLNVKAETNNNHFNKNSYIKICVVSSYSLQNDNLNYILYNFLKHNFTNKHFYIIEYYLNSEYRNNFYFNKRIASQYILKDMKQENPNMYILIGDTAFFFVGIQHILQEQEHKPVIVLNLLKPLDKYKNENTYYVTEKDIIFSSKLNPYKLTKVFNNICIGEKYILYNRTSSYSLYLAYQLKKIFPKAKMKEVKNTSELLQIIYKLNKSMKNVVLFNTLNEIVNIKTNNPLYSKNIARLIDNKSYENIIIVSFNKYLLPYSDFTVYFKFNNSKIENIIELNINKINCKNIVINDELWRILE